ncbi:Hypothetical protein FKW44_016161, partial [Caligus rogercresseyi]
MLLSMECIFELDSEYNSILSAPDLATSGAYTQTKRGFLVLLDTYRFDLNALLHGTLKMKDHSFNSVEKLRTQDLLDLSKE